MSVLGAVLSQVEGSWDYKVVPPYVKTLEISENISFPVSGNWGTQYIIPAEQPTDVYVAYYLEIHSDSDPVNGATGFQVESGVSPGGLSMFPASAGDARLSIYDMNGVPRTKFVHATLHAVFQPTR